MITNIFKRFSIQAIAASFFLSFSANLFVLYCRAGGQLYNQIYSQSLILSFTIILIIGIISFSEAKRLNLKFGSSHLLSFPTCILLFYQGQGLNYQKLILGFSLLIAANIFFKEIKQSNIPKDLFNLGLIFTIISYININLSLFFLSTLLILTKSIDKKKAIFSLAIGIFTMLLILMTVYHYKTGQILYKQPEFLAKNIVIDNFKTSSEFIWILTVISAFIFSILKNKKTKLIDKNNGEKFMLFWLIISVIFRLFELYIDSTLWLLSFIPTAFFIGNIFFIIKKDNNREWLFYSIWFLGIISRLFLNDIIFYH